MTTLEAIQLLILKRQIADGVVSADKSPSEAAQREAQAALYAAALESARKKQSIPGGHTPEDVAGRALTNLLKARIGAHSPVGDTERWANNYVGKVVKRIITDLFPEPDRGRLDEPDSATEPKRATKNWDQEWFARAAPEFLSLLSSLLKSRSGKVESRRMAQLEQIVAIELGATTSAEAVESELHGTSPASVRTLQNRLAQRHTRARAWARLVIDRAAARHQSWLDAGAPGGAPLKGSLPADRAEWAREVLREIRQRAESAKSNE